MKDVLKIAAAVALSGLTSAALAGLPVYNTSFETAEGFNAGTYNQGQSLAENWSVQTGSVEVINDGAGSNDGDHFVTLNANTQLDRDFDGMEQTGVVWVEGYFRGVGSSVKLGGDSEPVYPVEPASAIVHFSEEVGIQMFDGDGAGGLKDGLEAGVALGAGNANDWHKITIQLDFDAKQWSLWVNDDKKNESPLGFRDDSVNSLRGFRNLAQDSADFDSFRVVVPLSGDSNGDSVIDAADLFRVYEFIAANESSSAPPSTDPIVLSDADLNGDGMVSENDSIMLVQFLIGGA